MLKQDDKKDAERLAMADRLREILDEPGVKAAVARECRITEQAVNGWISTGRIGKNRLPIVVRKCGVNLHWLITGEGPKHPTGALDREDGAGRVVNGEKSNVEEAPALGPFRRIPVVGAAQLGDNGHWADLEYPVGHGDGYVSYPTRDPNAYALRCKGDSMKPRIQNDEFVVVEPNTPPIPGDEVLVKAVDGRVMVKKFLYERDGRIHLWSINELHPPQSFAKEELERFHPVVAIVKKALWRAD